MTVARHEWFIEPAQFERHEQRRGRRHAFETLTPKRTALVVIDMVPFFVDASPFARGIVPTINDLALAIRSAGGTVAWVVPAATDPLPARVEFLGREAAEIYRRSGGHGSPRDRVAPELDRVDIDLFMEKAAASAFFPGSCSLVADLEQRGVDTVVLVGTVANVCVESSARDASTLGFRTIVVADAVAAICDADLNATLHTMYRSFADVRSADDVAALLG